MAHRSDSLVIRSRVDFETNVKKQAFIRALEQVATVSVACKVSGVTKPTAYRWRQDDPQFATDWDNALELASESLESATYLKLAQVLQDSRKRLSMPEAKLIEMFLAGAKPEKYRQRAVEIESNHFNFTIDWASVPDDIMEAFNNGRLTLQDVYERTIQPKEPQGSDTSEDRRSERSG